jgi:NitT/TauT family transport system substrate-binding protein
VRISLLRLAAGLAIATVMGACGTEKQTPAALKQIKVGIGPFLSNIPTYVAVDEGFFKDQGLELKFVPVLNSREALPALTRGSLDVVVGSTSTALLNAIVRRSGVKVVADEGQILAHPPCNRQVLVADTAIIASGGLKTLADLKGQKVVYSDTGYESYVLEKGLASVGLTLKDVIVADVPDEALPDALGRSDLHVAYMSEPDLARAIGTGKAKAWQPLDGFVPGLQTSMVVFGPNLLTKDVDAGKRFVLANLQGIHEFQKRKTASNVATAAKISGLDASLIRKTCWPTYAKDGHIGWPSIEGIQRSYRARNLIDGTTTQDEFWTSTYVDYANDKL